MAIFVCLILFNHVKKPNMKLVMQTNLNGATSNIPDSTGRPYTASFSAQAANVPSFHHSGEKNNLFLSKKNLQKHTS